MYCLALVTAVAQLNKNDRTFVTNYQSDLFVADFRSWMLRSHVQYEMH